MGGHEQLVDPDKKQQQRRRGVRIRRLEGVDDGDEEMAREIFPP